MKVACYNEIAFLQVVFGKSFGVINRILFATGPNWFLLSRHRPDGAGKLVVLVIGILFGEKEFHRQLVSTVIDTQAGRKETEKLIYGDERIYWIR